MKRLMLIAALLLSGCMGQSTTKSDYDRVYIGYTVAGGPTPKERHTTEHVINNTAISYTTRYSNGTVSYRKTGEITLYEYRQIGKNVAETGVYGMLDRYTPAAAQTGDTSSATLLVSIDGRNKTVEMKPYVEEYLPGNIQKIISEVKHVTQSLQP